jgi:YD repeat-containing protein
MKKILLSFYILFLVYITRSQEANQYLHSPYVEHYAGVIPKTPNASNFKVHGNTSVDFSSGVPNISIPIYTLEQDGIKIPISISYDASGVKVGDLASVVGLKWRLNAGGGIFRSVNGGVADENGWISTNKSYLESSWYNSNPVSLRATQESLKDSERDHDPDRFNYSFPGGSGAFIFRPKTGLNSLSIMKERPDKITIIPSSNFNTFQAKDFQGNVFDFGAQKEFNENTSTNTSLVSGGSINFSSSNTMAYKITGWMLDKVTTKNNEIINFGYSEYKFDYQLNAISQRLSKGVIDCTAYNANNPEPLNRYTKESTSIIYRPKNQLISLIESDNIKVSFIYSNNANASDWKKQLNKIIIIDKVKNKQKAFHFVYGTFNGDPRLQLKEVYEVAFHTDGESALPRKPSYKFTYNSSSLPNKDSMSKDYWGYYNGKSNTTLIPNNTLSFITLNAGFSNQLANREVDTYFVKAGLLEKIQYPTGGSTEFEFESNQTSGVSPKNQGGLRVKEIKDLDGEGNTYNHTYYSYDEFHGLDWNVSVTQRHFPGAHTFSSDFILTDPSLNKSGHYYGKVTVKQKKSDFSFIKSEYIFEDNSSLFSFSSLPKEIIQYKGNAIVQKKEFFYNKNVPETISWNQLGDRDICYDDFTGIGVRRKVGYGEPINTYYKTYKHLLKTEVTTNYNVDTWNLYGLYTATNYKPQVLVKYYTYNNDLLITNETTDGRYNEGDPRQANHPSFSEDYDSNGEYFLVDTTYPSDYPNDASLQNLVTSKNLKGLPISKIVTNKGQQIQGQFFTYSANGDIKESYKYNKGQGSNNSLVSYVPNNYDLFANYTAISGKPTQIQREDSSYISYIWGYNNSLPIAKIENARYSQVLSAISNLNSSYNTISKLQLLSNTDNDRTIDAINSMGVITKVGKEGDLREALRALRNALPNSQLTVFTYDVLVGVTSVTDPRGETIYYHYDNFGRLHSVKDSKGKILSLTEYNYKN